MSALPAQIPELSPEPLVVRPSAGSSAVTGAGPVSGASTVTVAGGGVPAGAAGARLRAERRAEMAQARRLRERWAVFSVAVLVCLFALTVGVLDVLH